MLRESFDWLKPSPLWQSGLTDARKPDFFQPQLLQFNDDNFMAAFLAAAASRDTTALKAAVMAAPAPDQSPIKLFQPAHGVFYLVAAALSCRVPGFPERTIDKTDGESVFFVLRKFVNGAEYGWVVDGTNKSWQPLNGPGRTLLDKEERLPLFPATGSDQRRVFVGYIPVASRDIYAVSPAVLASLLQPDEQALGDPRIEELEGRFTTPLTIKTDAKNNEFNVIDVTANAVAAANVDAATVQALRVRLSVYLLLDLWDFLFKELPDIAIALRDDPGAAFSGDKAAEKTQLMSFLAGQHLGGSLTLAAAIGAAANHHDALDAAGDLETSGPDPFNQLGFDQTYDLSAAVLTIDLNALEANVQAALPSEVPPISLPKLGADAQAQYAVRCVYERPQCVPSLRVVSRISVPFGLATFFDADAPARPVRIVLPTDVSIAGLRKFNKGVTFLISSSLQKKISRITGHEKDLLKDPTPGLGDESGIALMCSFSIQIIFIVAFILLLIFVIILNICFWWIAFFRICIPIPKKLLSG
jgi:hypothetical protein